MSNACQRRDQVRSRRRTEVWYCQSQGSNFLPRRSGEKALAPLGRLAEATALERTSGDAREQTESCQHKG
jgi:hypothetical protein